MGNDFGSWTRLSDFNRADHKTAATYLIAIDPVGPAKPENGSVIYIGETKRTIGQRIAEFTNSGFLAKNGHSGGWTFAEKFPDVTMDQVHVSVLDGYEPGSVEASVFAPYLEKQAIKRYYETHGSMPSCNKGSE